MAISAIEQGLGFHSEESFYIEKDIQHEYLCNHKVVNLMNGLGWVPGLSIAIGVARLFFVAEEWQGGSTNSADKPWFLGVQMLRGSLEVLCAGSLFFVFDILSTLHRTCTPEESVKEAIAKAVKRQS